MSTYPTIHALLSADFTNYDYYELLALAGAVTINGTAMTLTNDVVLPIAVTSTGSTSGDIFLIGKKRPEAYKNPDGTWPIK